MKKQTLLTLFALLCLWPAAADEGMWLPSLISARIDDMRAKGFRLSAEEIYSINRASMKDAVVLFDGGCTGELVSAEGLLLTNHHCGYDAIQRHSTVEHDYLTHGFWARSRAEELPNKGLNVRFLVRMEEVTDRIAEAILRDEQSILTVSSLLTGQYGLYDVCLSLPCIVGVNGLEQVLPIHLDEEEMIQLRASAKAISDAIQILYEEP